MDPLVYIDQSINKNGIQFEVVKKMAEKNNDNIVNVMIDLFSDDFTFLNTTTDLKLEDYGKRFKSLIKTNDSVKTHFSTINDWFQKQAQSDEIILAKEVEKERLCFNSFIDTTFDVIEKKFEHEDIGKRSVLLKKHSTWQYDFIKKIDSSQLFELPLVTVLKNKQLVLYTDLERSIIRSYFLFRFSNNISSKDLSDQSYHEMCKMSRKFWVDLCIDQKDPIANNIIEQINKIIHEAIKK